MHDWPVLEACDLEDAALDRVVGGEVAQVDQRRTAHVRPAAAPHALPAGLPKDLPINQNHVGSQNLFDFYELTSCWPFLAVYSQPS